MADISTHDTHEELLGYRDILSTFTENTTSHGIPHIHHAKGVCKVTFWTIISLISTAGLIWNSYNLISTYASFSVSVSVSIESNRSISFPAVTICNFNAIRQHSFEKVSSLKALTDAYKAGGHEGQSKADRLKLSQRIYETVSDMSEVQKRDLGYELSEMILDCEFDRQACNMTSDFEQFYDPTFGNCYIYNWGKRKDFLKFSYEPGASGGLSITFNINQLQYMGDLTESAGVRVVVHNQSAMPFPSDEGVSVSPGELTFVGVQRTDISQMSSPYGTCYTSSSKDPILNVFSEKFHVSYTIKACYITCYQRHLIHHCDCGDGMFPLSGQAFGNRNVSSCKSNNATQVACEMDLYTKYATGTLECMCHSPCMETGYKTKSSSVIWPSDAHLGVLRAEYGSRPSVKHLFENGSADYKANIGKVNVYFEDFIYEDITESLAYTFGSLLSDLGGILGLYLGFSAFTIIEFLELGGHLLVWAGTYCYTKNTNTQRSSSPLSQVRGLAQQVDIGSTISGLTVGGSGDSKSAHEDPPRRTCGPVVPSAHPPGGYAAISVMMFDLYRMVNSLNRAVGRAMRHTMYREGLLQNNQNGSNTTAA